MLREAFAIDVAEARFSMFGREQIEVMRPENKSPEAFLPTEASYPAGPFRHLLCAGEPLMPRLLRASTKPGKLVSQIPSGAGNIQRSFGQRLH